jgi:HK97 family phage major capsid protein
MAKLLKEKQIKRLLGQKLKRAVAQERAALVVDEEARTIEMSFSSDAAIEHWFGRLILNHDAKCVRLERLRNGGPFLLDHDRTKLVGVHEKVDTNGHKLSGTIRFSKSDLGRTTFDDIRDGIRPNTSVGLILHEMHFLRETDEEGPVYQSDDWEPIEDSSVTVPADITVGVGRGLDDDLKAHFAKLMRDESECEECDGAGCDVCEPPDGDGDEDDEAEQSNNSGGARAAHKPNTEVRTQMAKVKDGETQTQESDEVARAREITEMGEILGEAELARDHVVAGNDLATFRAAVAAKRKAAQPKTPTEDPEATAARQGGDTQLARVSSRVSLRAFKGEGGAALAHRFGHFLNASLFNAEQSRTFCREQGIALKRAQSESDNETGGFLVPTEFENVMIDLRLEYGIFRRNANVVPMAGLRKERPRRRGGLTAYPIGARGDNRRLTESKKNWDMVGLDAKKWGVLAKYEEELSEDSVIAMADDLASEIAYAFTSIEDECGFLGDGTAAYHGITGLIPKLTGLHATVANIAGIQVASGNQWSEIVLADILGMVGRLPSFARKTGQVKWYCSNEFWATVLCRVALALGGNALGQIQNEIVPVFLGKPVEIVEVMPHVEANSQVPLLYGNLAQAAMFGDRRGVTVKMTDSNDTDFEEDLMAIKGTERFDINVHDVGNASATATARKPGPVVALQTAAA